MSLLLGRSKRGRELRLDAEQRSRHIHVVGASGTGKSKLLEAMVRQDILAGRGLCLIDPHGQLADSVLAWCAALRVGKHRRIHVIDPADDAWCPGFNPLGSTGTTDLTARVDAMVTTCAEVWGGEDINQTPLLTTCLALVFYALAVNDLTLLEAVELTSSGDPREVRQRLTSDLPDPVYASYWRDMSTLSRREFEERFSSTRRRLLRFLGSPTVRRIVGQREHPLDLQQVMDAGDIVIVKLTPRGSLSKENARLLGALLTRELYLCALARDQSTALRKPFSLFIDECQDYLTGDVAHMLDETRKFGLHTILAHQRLGQLRARSAEVFNGVMTGGQTKIVFGGLTDEDAEIMAKEVYRSTFNLERPKHVLDKPIVVDEVPYWLESESETEGASQTIASSDSATWSDGTGSPTRSTDPLASYDTHNVGGGSTESFAQTSMSSSTTGRAQTLKPVRVVMPTAVHSLDEELHLAIVKLRELPNQAAILKRRGSFPVRFRPETIKPALARPEETAKLVTDASTASPYFIKPAQADAEIAARATSLSASAPVTDADFADEDVFWRE